MWHDTLRFVRCAKQTFKLPPPVHEYGVATVGAPFIAPKQCHDLHSQEAAGPHGDLSHPQPLDDLVRLPFADGSAGTVACLNVLQHVTDPGAVAQEMIRLLAPGGIFLVCSCAGGRLTPNVDLLWRPAPHAFQRLLAPLEATLIGWQGRDGDPHSIYALGCKAPVTPKYLASANEFLKTFRQTLAQEQRAVSWTEKVRDWLARLSGRPTTGRARADYYHSQFVMHAPVDAQFQHDMLATCLQIEKTGTRLDLTQ
jgi:SAM-dependent methyltransferase